MRLYVDIQVLSYSSLQDKREGLEALERGWEGGWWGEEEGGSASPSATSPSRWGSALRSTWTCRCQGQICEGIHVVAGGGQWGGTRHKRERWFTHMQCLWQCLKFKVFPNAQPAQNVATQWPSDCLQELWQEVQPQQQHQQTQEVCVQQASPQGELLALLHVRQGPPLTRSSSFWRWGGRFVEANLTSMLL